MLVHPKLAHFFLMLFYVCKLEHVVRNYARVWVDGSSGGQGGQRDIASLCREFEAQDNLLSGMYVMFRHGISHVLESLESGRGSGHGGGV